MIWVGIQNLNLGLVLSVFSVDDTRVHTRAYKYRRVVKRPFSFICSGCVSSGVGSFVRGKMGNPTLQTRGKAAQ